MLDPDSVVLDMLAAPVVAERLRFNIAPCMMQTPSTTTSLMHPCADSSKKILVLVFEVNRSWL